MKLLWTTFAAALAAAAFGAETRAPGAHDVRVTLDSHPEWIALRDRALGYARNHMEELGGNWDRQIVCMPKAGIIWQWDSCLMALYAGYTPENLNGLGNLNNLYKMQSPDGFVSMAYVYETRKPAWEGRINPPLYAWVEWLYARRTGDKSRLAKAYDVSSRLWKWTKAHRTRKTNGLYWFEDTGSSGMDNSPRSGYFAEDLKGSDVCFVDLCCQQVLAARCLADIAEQIGKKGEAPKWRAEADELSQKINKLMWCEKTGFYHDVYVETNNKLAVKTAAAFWAIVSGVANDAQVAKLAAHMTNPATFGARHPVPTLSRDDPNYDPKGGYWLGGVWPPTNYMIVNGLRARGHRALARDVAKKHLACMAELLGTKDYDSIWECYSPDNAAPSTAKLGEQCRRDFVGWGGLGPFVMLVEDVLGVDVNALENRVTWHLSELGRQGVSDLPFNGGSLTLACDVKDAKNFSGTVKTDRPLALTVISPDGTKSVTKQIAAGETAF
ncbi:MAG: hypothetical protein MJ138_02465 [Kiritimatiellae bacterium]|nr:hypothetical protein [Kiritimatiellia bacterium]